MHLDLINFKESNPCAMKLLSTVVLLFSLYLTFGQNYCFQNVQVIDLESSPMVSSKTVIIEGESISEILDADMTPPAGFTIIDGTGKYLMAGISEMHAHIPVSQDGNDDYVKETLFLYLSNGITLIRGMLGNPYHLELRKQVEQGEVLSPRIYTSSPSLNGNSIPDIPTAIEKVTEYQEAGYDFLKLHPGIKLEVFNQIVQTANQVGIPYAGHVSVHVGIRRALQSKYGSVDHLDGYLEGLVTDEVDPTTNGFFGYNFTDLVKKSEIKSLTTLTKSNGVWVVPTQSLFTRWFSPEDPSSMMQAREIAYMPAKTRYSWLSSKTNLIGSENYNSQTYGKFLNLRKKMLKTFHKNGVGILLGSDAPQVMNVPGFSIQHEMQAMADAGIPNDAILKSGTINPAAYFQAEDQYGRIKSGLSADLILLRDNPLLDIRNMQAIEGVMVRGKWLSRDAIDARLEEIVKKHQE